MAGGKRAYTLDALREGLSKPLRVKGQGEGEAGCTWECSGRRRP